MIDIGFTPAKYKRVRDWLLSAMAIDPDVISEGLLLDKLQSGEWHLVTSAQCAGVFQLYDTDEGSAAHILLAGGERNRSLKDMLTAIDELADVLARHGVHRMTGTPRKQFHRLLKKKGFQEQKKELVRYL